MKTRSKITQGIVLSLLPVIIISLVFYGSYENYIEKYPVLYKAEKSEVFDINVNGSDVFVEHYKDIHYTNFGMKGETEIKITLPNKVKSYSISPVRYKIESECEGNEIKLKLKVPKKLVVYVNELERLFIFANQILNETPDTVDNKVVSINNYLVDVQGKQIETLKIQNAINETAVERKILYFPAGVYLTGTLELKTNSQIYLAPGAVILGSTDRKDYPQDEGFQEADQVNDPENYTNKGWKMTYSRLILIGEAENVKIWGRGIIDGQGAIVRQQGKPANLIRVRDSKNVVVEGIMLRDPAAWNTHILASDNVAFRDIKMINDRKVYNTDGIDPDGATNVTVDNCFMYCSDDNIAIKTSGNSNLLQDSHNIVVKNCVFLTKKSAMKLGTETRRNISNVTFENNEIVESDRGMSLYSRDGATFENIFYINNHFEKLFEDNRQRLLDFDVNFRSISDAKSYVKKAGQIKNVIIKNCTAAGFWPKESTMSGLNNEHKISGVQFINFKINGKSRISLNDAHIKINNFVDDVTFGVNTK
ncbi:MAG: glycoside hydrolase [Bacteroidetes bacterium]|nr:glycoside hydrolase [Bacteroidota bacterium]